MRPDPRRGFTLLELLIVIVIVALLTAATIPVVLPALAERRVSEGARILQAALSAARDQAIRANAPRGIRLLPDPAFAGSSTDPRFAANRILSIEPAPDYFEGLVFIGNTLNPTGGPPVVLFPYPPSPAPAPGSPYNGSLYTGMGFDPRLHVTEAKLTALGAPNEPTSWYWNIRQGDRFRLQDSGRYYTIAGPNLLPNVLGGAITNPERFINMGAPATGTLFTIPSEVLFLVNGQDDDGDGYVDESFDGIDNDGDGIIDPGFDGIDNDGVNGIDNPEELFYSANTPGNFSWGEWEPESLIGSQYAGASPTVQRPYHIFRRPVPVEGSKEVQLPTDIVIDLTTSVASAPGMIPERSRLPFDAFTGYVDIMIQPNGQAVRQNASSGFAPDVSLPFYHFWITDKEDVYAPVAPTAPAVNFLPLPTPDPTLGDARRLRADRRLVTLSTKTGQIVTNSIETFNAANVNAPYQAAQAGIREQP